MRLAIQDKDFFGETAVTLEITVTDDLLSTANVDCSFLDVDDNLIAKTIFTLRDIAATSGSSAITSYSDYWAKTIAIPDAVSMRSRYDLVRYLAIPHTGGGNILGVTLKSIPSL